MFRALRLAVLVALLGPAVRAAAAPKLLVVVVVDQMRADYVDWYGAHWKGGLRRLYDQGAWVRNARYPYLETVTCAGHFTLMTGTFPHRHGMILNAWYDRAAKQVIDCTDDPESPVIGDPPPLIPRGDSARNLVVPTLVDEMAKQLPRTPKLAAFSMKARSAIPLAGHTPGVVVWFGGAGWVTSKNFAAGPAPWMSRYARPLAQYGPWTRLLPASEYRGEDDAAGERPTLGWGRTFPHPLTDAPVSPFARWAVSPAGDEALAALARAALTEMKLGQGPGTDVLGVSLSETDLVGHAFGPRSHEVQDTLLRVDRLLGELLDALDSQLPDQYTLVLASDHGVAAIPEQVAGGGRLLPANAKKGLDAALAAELGPGEHAIGLQLNEVYLAPGVHQRLVKKPGALGRVLTALRALPGIADVFDSAELGDASGLEGPRKAAALGYFQGRSGDLVIAPKPNWIVGALGTNHGSTGDYDQHVPVIFFGQGVKPGQYDRAVTPADVAPTLARIVGVKMPRAEGAPINEVLAPAPARRAVRRPR